MLEMPESWDAFQGRHQTQCGYNPRERSMLQCILLKGVQDLKSSLTSDTEKKNLEIARLFFSDPLDQCFLTMLLSFPFGMSNVYPVLLYTESM